MPQLKQVMVERLAPLRPLDFFLPMESKFWRRAMTSVRAIVAMETGGGAGVSVW